MPLKYLSNFWRILEITLINCEINLILTWPEYGVILSATGATKFKKTDTKLYVLVETLSTQDNEQLLQQLKSDLNKTIDWNKYQPKVSPKRYFLVDPNFQGVNRLFVLSFKNEGDRKVHIGYYFPKVEIKDYNIMIDEKNFFDQPVKSDIRTYDNIRKIATGPENDYTTGCLLDYNYFNNYH